MAAAAEPALEEQLWTIAVARLLFGPEMSIQAPPNLQPRELEQLMRAGINDWGGVSPVTPDHVNPEAPWPHLADLGSSHCRRRPRPGRAPGASDRATRRNRTLGPMPGITPRVRRLSDSRGFARADGWFAGSGARAARCGTAPAQSAPACGRAR